MFIYRHVYIWREGKTGTETDRQASRRQADRDRMRGRKGVLFDGFKCLYSSYFVSILL